MTDMSLPDARMSLGPAALDDLFPEGEAFRRSLRTFSVLLTLAAIIATLGLFQDSVASIIGAMVESNLESGNQPFPVPLDQLRFGVSITDGCIGWKESEAAIRAGRSRYTFAHPRERSRVEVAADPDAAVAFDESFVREMYADHGLDIEDTRYGAWSGRHTDVGFQDIVVASKSGGRETAP